MSLGRSGPGVRSGFSRDAPHPLRWRFSRVYADRVPVRSSPTHAGRVRHRSEPVDLDVHAGEVLALLGENGAGKSTLMKVLGGAHRADAGVLEMDGAEVSFGSPQEARAAGVAVIHQEFNLIPELTAAENIFLGQETTRAGFVPHGDERRRAAAVQTARSPASATCCRDIRRPTGSDGVAGGSPRGRGPMASSNLRRVSSSTGSPLSSRRPGSTGIAITEYSRRTTS